MNFSKALLQPSGIKVSPSAVKRSDDPELCEAVVNPVSWPREKTENPEARRELDTQPVSPRLIEKSPDEWVVSLCAYVVLRTLPAKVWLVSLLKRILEKI